MEQHIPNQENQQDSLIISKHNLLKKYRLARHINCVPAYYIFYLFYGIKLLYPYCKSSGMLIVAVRADVAAVAGDAR